MKLFTLFLLLTINYNFAFAQSDKLPKGTIKKGSLSNQKLIQDAMLGVSAKVATLGCEKIESFQAYVMQMPQGEVGSRFWLEKWMVKGCTKQYPVVIRFSESGLGAANYSIE